MKLLLDTHIWLWMVGEPHRLSRRVAKELDSPGNQLWLSPISIWETLLLHRKRRINISEDFGVWLATTLNKLPVSEAPLTFEVAAAMTTVSLPHTDPADLFLAASAKAFDLTLVTADEKLLATPGLRFLPNR